MPDAVAFRGLETSPDGAEIYAIIGAAPQQNIAVLELERDDGFPVQGRIEAPDGAPLAADVTLVPAAGGPSFEARADENGAFEISGVPEGRYSLVVEAAGFQTLERVNVVVDRGPLVLRTLRVSEPPPEPGAVVVSLGSFIQQIVADPVRPRAYLADASSSSILVVDTEAAALLASIPVGSLPESMDTSPDGSRLFVSLTGGGSVAIVDLERLAFEGEILLPGAPGALAWCGPDRLFVGTGESSRFAEEVQVVDPVARDVVGSLAARAVLGCNRAQSSLFTFEQGFSVPRVETWDAGLPLPQVVDGAALFGGGCTFVGRRFEARFSPDGNFGYFVADGCTESDDGVAPAIRTSDLTRVGAFSLEWEPTSIALSPDGLRLYATHGTTVRNATTPTEERHSPDVPDVHVFETTHFQEIDRLLLSRDAASTSTIPFFEAGLRSVEISADGRTLLVDIGTPPNQDVEILRLPEPSPGLLGLVALPVLAALARARSAARRPRT